MHRARSARTAIPEDTLDRVHSMLDTWWGGTQHGMSHGAIQVILAPKAKKPTQACAVNSLSVFISVRSSGNTDQGRSAGCLSFPR